jgi:hypothetical protein
MKVIKIIGIALLAIVAFKIAMVILGLATALVFSLFWIAVLFVAIMVIWQIISGSSSKTKKQHQIESNYIPQMEEASRELEAQLREIKRKNSVKN